MPVLREGVRVMKIVEVDVNNIIPYKNNPRNNAKAIEKVANSIKEFGFKIPIVLDKNNVIVAGHTRLAAALALGYEKVPVIYADDLSEEQVKAFRIADNSTADMAGWDFVALDEELEKVADMDMDRFGFAEKIDESEIDALFTEPEKEEPTGKGIQCPYCGEWFEP